MKKQILYWILWGILLLEYAYIFLVLLNYDMAWMNPEKVFTHAWILENGSNLRWEDIIKSLNIDIIEVNAERLSRPISNLVEVLDTKFRANCWNFFVPHPSFSSLWPVLFLALPVFLYRFFINMGCQRVIALSGVCLYLSSIGFLGPIVMMFHPSKSLVNFFGVFSLWGISVLYKKTVPLGENVSIKNISNFWIFFIGFLVSMYMGFFSDETGLFIYVVNLVLLFPVLNRVKERKILWAIVLLIPVLYLITLQVFLPYLHFVVRGRVINFTHYEACPHLSSLFFPNWGYLWTNCCWLFSDYPHLMSNFRNSLTCWLFFLLQVIYSGLFVFIVVIFVRRNLFVALNFWAKKALVFLGLLVAYVFFQTFQLSANAHVWGVWWYGSLFSLIYFITFTFILQEVWGNEKNHLFQKCFVFIVAILVMESLIFTTYRINIFKHQNLDRNNYQFMDIFNGKINPYREYDFLSSAQRSRCKYLYARNLWEKAKQKDISSINSSQMEYCRTILNKEGYFPVEILYESFELRRKK
ncbi:MAG: hypothetical protein HQL15_02210 [Candidatus Omnitrophica bacterium]|nr:hypothetical protein [Candidatus Omnitrophota bacterium]